MADPLAAASELLAAASDTPRLDAELLLAHALGVSREELLLACPPLQTPPKFAELVARRAAGEPLTYIVGHRDFWTLRLAVTPDVLIPRPDSETLIEAAIAHFSGRAPSRILDLGTGSGALLLAALDHWRDASGLGIDASPDALGVAARNAHALGLADRAEFRVGDWLTGVDERFDLVLCNPPYIADGDALTTGVRDHEPHQALFAGPDGLACYRRIAPALASALRPGGAAMVEVGHRQAASAGQIFVAAGLRIEVRRDLGGRDRCLKLTS